MSYQASYDKVILAVIESYLQYQKISPDHAEALNWFRERLMRRIIR